MDVVGSETLVSRSFFVLDLLTDFSSLETFHNELRIMEEIILSILAGDESVAFFFVEFLNSTLHCLNPFFRIDEVSDAIRNIP